MSGYSSDTANYTFQKLLKSKYTDEELEERLDLLNKGYDDVLSSIAEQIKGLISLYGESEGGKETLSRIFGKDMNDINRILAKLDIGENQPLTDSIDTILKFLAQKARESNEQKID